MNFYGSFKVQLLFREFQTQQLTLKDLRQLHPIDHRQLPAGLIERQFSRPSDLAGLLTRTEWIPVFQRPVPLFEVFPKTPTDPGLLWKLHKGL